MDSRTCVVIEIERIGIAEADAEMRRLQAERIAGRIPDTLLFVEHPEVVTLGRRAQVGGVPLPAGYPAFEVDRGGGLTWHGPGQLTVYPIIAWDLPGERSVRGVLDRLETWIIAALAHLGFDARRDERMRGAWIGEHILQTAWNETLRFHQEEARSLKLSRSQYKVASIGVAFSHWVSRHGISINYATPAGRVERLECCGLPRGTTSSLLAATGRTVTRGEVQAALLATLSKALGRQVAGRSDW